MTNTEILTKAIQKAIDGGWQGFSYEEGYFTGPDPEDLLKAKYFSDIHQFVLDSGAEFELNELIFNHDFARALWGDELIKNEYIGAYEDKAPGDWAKAYTVRPAWQAHLQQMVVAEDPIAYLGEHLDD